MRYWLSHITQMSVAKELLLLAMLVGMWLWTFLHCASCEVLPCALTCGLSCVNGVILTLFFRRIGLFHILSPFPLLTYTCVVAGMTPLHPYWRGQVVAAALLLACCLLTYADSQHEPVQITFWTTLLLCLASLAMPCAVCLVPVFWVVWIIRRVNTFRAWNASLLALVLYAVGYVVVGYFAGNLAFPQGLFGAYLEHAWSLLVLVLAGMVGFLPYHFPSVFSGALWLVSIIGAAIVYIIFNVNIV